MLVRKIEIVEKYSEYIVDKICKEGKLLFLVEHNKIEINKEDKSR